MLDQLVKSLGNVWDDRNQKEALEERFGLSLGTHDESIAWTGRHLDVVEGGLGRLPAEHVAPLENLILGGAAGWGAHLEDDIWLSEDAGGLGPAEKHPGDTSVLGGHDHPVAQLAMTVPHEVGHEVQEQYGEAVDRLLAAAGWRSGLYGMQAGLDRDEMVSLLNHDDSQLSKNDTSYRVDEKYMKREYAAQKEAGVFRPVVVPKFLAFDNRCVPEEGAHSGDSDVDSWAYARTDPNEYFAEMYTKAVNLPELLYEDLVGEPAAMVEAAELSNDGMARQLAEGARCKKLQWDILRGEIFGVNDTMIDEQAMYLESVSPVANAAELVHAFRTDAERAMTPHQLETLLASYLER